MSERKIDPVSLIETTGHEWNGITELDAPVPRVIVGWYGISIAAALLLFLLLPAIPLVTTFTPGLLGYSTRGSVERDLKSALERQGNWKSRMNTLSASDILIDPDLRSIALAGGRAAFKMNCVACHGERGQGQRGYPNLTDGDWQWGASVETIAETITIGVNAQHEDTRVGQMLAFGDDGILDRSQIGNVVSYVRSLSGLDHDVAQVAQGAAVFAEHCASCHGEDGKGKQDVGAPNLTDDISVYGSDHRDIAATVRHGRQGWMPHWSERLDPETIKMLAIYVKSLSGEK